MIRANCKDKNTVINILTNSFLDNKSVNYIVKQDSKKTARIRTLMSYSFEMCLMFGDVFLSNDKKGCVLIIVPDRKRVNLKSIIEDLKLIVMCTGWSNAKKAMQREAKIKKLHTKDSMYYLWFIGVLPEAQQKGTGGTLLREVIQHAESIKRPIYLETSSLQNIAWYQKLGFKIYNELNFGYTLYFLRNN